METQIDNLKHARGNVETRFQEIERLTLDGHKSLIQGLVRAHRFGFTKAQSTAVFNALRSLIGDAEATFEAAIAQPEPKVGGKSRLQL